MTRTDEFARRIACAPSFDLDLADADRAAGERAKKLLKIDKTLDDAATPRSVIHRIRHDTGDGRTCAARRACAAAARPARSDKRKMKGRRFGNDTGGVGRLGGVAISEVAATKERFDVCRGPRARESG